MEKTWKFQIVYAALTNLCKQTNWLHERPYETGVSPTATLSHWDSPNVEGTVFQTFWNHKQRSCIQFITNEQVKLISFLWDGVDFTLGNVMYL